MFSESESDVLPLHQSAKIRTERLGNSAYDQRGEIPSGQANDCNFLIMDEPTNHLDVQAKEALKSALMDFAGTVLLVSHEEAFYREWAQRVISVEK